jgi:TRAP-type C4-dicarboxylate transport system permease small subunit
LPTLRWRPRCRPPEAAYRHEQQGDCELTDTTAVMGSGPYATLRRGIDAVDAALMFVGCLMLFALMCVVVSDVGMRYFFNSPLQWSYQVISSYLMPGLFFMAVSHTLKAHGHVAVDIVHNYVGPRTRYVFEALASLVALPVFALCSWVSSNKTLADIQTAAVESSGLAIPTWTVSIMLPIGFGLLTLRLLMNTVGYAGTLLTGEEMMELPPISGTEEGAE